MAVFNNMVADTVFTFEWDGSQPVALRAHGISKAKAKVESWLADGLFDLPAVQISWTGRNDNLILSVFDGDNLVAVGTLSRGASKTVFSQSA
jgi:hypothetical protein